MEAFLQQAIGEKALYPDALEQLTAIVTGGAGQ